VEPKIYMQQTLRLECVRERERKDNALETVVSVIRKEEMGSNGWEGATSPKTYFY
jgi:hypothetical protein